MKYASILIQAITIQLDEAFLYAVLDLTKLEGVDWETDSQKLVFSIYVLIRQALKHLSQCAN